MKVLVTGGAGFIGSHTAFALREKGCEVVILDNLDPKIHPSGEPPDLPEGARLIRGDVRDRAAVEEALAGVDAVFHFAAYQDYMPDFSRFFHVNSVGTALLYEVLVERGIRPKRVVVASSQAVYGEGMHRCPEHGLVQPPPRPLERLEAGEWDLVCPACGGFVEPVWSDEEHVAPRNSYAMSKLSQETIALNLGRQYGIPSVAMRYSIVQGPRQSFFNLYSGVCRIFCLNALRGRPSIVYEDGQQLRDYVNIEDVVRANLLVLEDERAVGRVFNVGGDIGYTVLEFTETVSWVLGSEIALEIPGTFRFGDTRHSLSNTAGLKELGWAPRYSPRKSVADYIAWVRELGGAGGADVPDADAAMREAGVVREARVEGEKARSAGAGSTAETGISGRSAAGRDRPGGAA